jgi:hypothetical protein
VKKYWTTVSSKIIMGFRAIPKIEWRDPIMKYSIDEAMNAELAKALESIVCNLSEKYPECDMELLVMRNLMKKRGESIRRSEVDSFKKLAISTLGTDKEINFNDAERGFLKAALADGMAGFREFIESIPVEAPISEDGTKMVDRGIEKKTL